MAKPKRHSSQALIEAAMNQFWWFGYHATSIDDLVRVTGVSRHGMYSEFGGKKALYLAVFDVYQQTVVTPAFGQVEEIGATMRAVKSYFNQQIDRAAHSLLPGQLLGPGCLVANAMTEIAPHDGDVRAQTNLHHHRLANGFLNAICNDFAANVPTKNAIAIAESMAIFTHGLWSTSRHITDANALRQAVRTFLTAIQLTGARS